MVACIALLAVGCAAPRRAAPATGLAACPDKPNCVSSLAPDPEHRVEPFMLAGDPAAAWSALRAAVAAMPRTVIVEERLGYLHAECTSRIFRFVDDLELLQSEAGDRAEVRSASRVGYGDMGVNRERVEALRAAAIAAGAVK
jgi:uncharacterized protein (DUF1499 family)